MNVSLPALDAEIDAALRQSIRDFGVVVPVVYNRGKLIDGVNRTRIAGELGLDVPRIDLDIVDEQADLLAVELNTARRQLTKEVRRSIVKSLIEAGYSQRVVAKAVGTDKKTVWKDIRAIGDVSPIQIPERSIGLDGKSRPATRKKAAPPRSGTTRAKNVGNAMHDRLQSFIGSTLGATQYFEEQNFAVLCEVLKPSEIERLARDMRALAASCRSIANHLQEVSHASQ